MNLIKLIIAIPYLIGCLFLALLCMIWRLTMDDREYR